ncbi:hypothetical protein LTS15_000004 [Exophiala xenobiotica]|nr:hypothetical protein LTS15_000004 [Exophiala xenobiotica]
MPHHNTLLALSVARRLAAITLGRPAIDDSEAIEIHRRWQQVDAELALLPRPVTMNHLVTRVQPWHVPFAPVRLAGANPPPPMPDLTDSVDDDEEEEEEEEEEEAEEEDEEDDEAARHLTPAPFDRRMASVPAGFDFGEGESSFDPIYGQEDQRPLPPKGVDARGRPIKMPKETRAKFNKRRLEYAAQHPDDAGAQNAAKVATRNQQSVEARKARRKETKKEKTKAAKK